MRTMSFRVVCEGQYTGQPEFPLGCADDERGFRKALRVSEVQRQKQSGWNVVPFRPSFWCDDP